MSKQEFDITTVTGRRKLAVRVDPYYRREGNGHLGFRCTGPNGEGTWMARQRHNGKYAYGPLGRFEEYKDAAKAFKGWAASLDSAVVAGVGLDAMSMTVADAVAYYLEESYNIRGDSVTHDNIRAMLERNVIGRPPKEGRAKSEAVEANPIAQIRLAKLTKVDMREFRKSLLRGVLEVHATRQAKASAYRVLRQFLAVLNKAHCDGLVATNTAWNGLEGFANTTANSEASYRYMTLAERHAAIAALPNEEYRNFLRVLLMIGARPIELRQLFVGDYNKHEGTLRLYSKKGGRHQERAREVPISAIPGVTAIIEAQCKNKLPGAPLFDVTKEKFGKAIKKAMTDADIEKASAYCFRHSFITDCLNANVDVLTVCRVTGTSMEMIDQTYGKLLKDKVQEAFKNVKFI